MTETPPAAIATRGLTKHFGGQTVVDGLDLDVPRGSVFGFLGPNGARKTTTIRMLLGLVAADDGSIRVLGVPMPHRLPSVLPRVGALVEGPAFASFLSGAVNLARVDAANPASTRRTRRERIHTALERVGLAAAAVMRAGRLLATGTLDDLRARSTPRVRVRTPDTVAAASAMSELGLSPERVAADDLHAALPATVPVEAVTAALVKAGVRVRAIATAGAPSSCWQCWCSCPCSSA